MEPRQFLTILKERWRSALLGGLVVLAAVVAATAVQTPMYESTTRTFVQPQAGASVDELNTGIVLAGQQIASYSDLVTTPLVLDPVIEELGLSTTSDELARRVTATVRPDTLIIEIKAKDEDPAVAAALADATAASLGTSLESLGSSSGTPAIGLTVVSPAVESTSPASPSILMNTAIGLVLALATAVTIALLRDHFDNRVRRVEDVEKAVDHPVIASVPAIRDAQSAPLVSTLSYEGPQSEAYRSLRTNLQFMACTAEGRTLLITSALPSEGKSSTAINLAAVFSQAGKRVLLIDADLRRPSVAAYTGLEGSAGLTTVLAGDADLMDVVQPMQAGGLDVLTSGVVPPNPSELLASSRMGELLAEAESRYDHVILDTSPLLAVTDPVVLAPRVGGTVVVARSDRTRRSQLEVAIDRLSAVGAPVLGIVLNRVHLGRTESYDYEYTSTPPAAPTHRGRASASKSAWVQTPRLDEGAARVARRYEPAVEAR
ncbi:polysaccharide biosynthesis tyrosine autokinase [Brachybacterium atlanticum]|nr:polysaccharide biosynthesis tyrosine autokinase [Brachybacterium atlanticum]